MPLFRPATEDQRAVGSAEAKRVGQGNFNRRFARYVRHVVQVALRIWRVKIDRGWKDLVAERENSDPGFQSTRAAQQMSGHGLGGTDGHSGISAEGTLDGLGFQRVAQWRG